MKKNILPALFLFLQAATAQAEIHTVDNRPGRSADFTEVQDAIDAALPGDTLYVMGSPDRYEATTLNKVLSIYGPGYFLGENDIPSVEKNHANISSLDITSTGSGSQIVGITVGGYYSSEDTSVEANDISFRKCYFYRPVHVGVSTQSNRISFEHCIIGDLGTSGTGLYLGYYSTSPGATEVLVSNCHLNYLDFVVGASSGQVNQCIIGGGKFFNATVRNSIFTGTHDLTTDDASTFEHSLAPNEDLPDGTGNIENADLSTVFVGWNVGSPPSEQTTLDTWFRLIPNATINQAIGAGTDGQDLGAYGGDSPYVVSGIPSLPRINSIVAPIIIGEGETLEVTVEASKGE